MYYNNCRICKSYSWGNELCYKCYQEEMNKYIKIINKNNNKCIKCDKIIEGILYCSNCYKKHTPLTAKEALEKYRNIYTEKRKAENQKEERKAIFRISETAQKFLNMDMNAILDTPTYYPYSKKTNISKRKCINCDKYARIGSYYCEDHKNIIEIEDYEIEHTNSEFTIVRNDILSFFSLFHSLNSNDNKSKPNNGFETYDSKLKYKCKNGIYVRSLSERDISNFLTDKGIEHIYEKVLKYSSYNAYTGYEKKKTLHPDFYIKGPIAFENRILKNVYIEFWGLDSKEYIEKKEYKLNVYKQINITLINVYKEDIEDIEKSLKYKLSHYIDNEINF